jgi:hypothetical protein
MLGSPVQPRSCPPSFARRSEATPKRRMPSEAPPPKRAKEGTRRATDGKPLRLLAFPADAGKVSFAKCKHHFGNTTHCFEGEQPKWTVVSEPGPKARSPASRTNGHFPQRREGGTALAEPKDTPPPQRIENGGLQAFPCVRGSTQEPSQVEGLRSPAILDRDSMFVESGRPVP